ncbi:MAG: tandem-95 repeat protein [Euryarchaeota archaeon]|nr:tandem-95 repeat protein [Euryarchaeota archaeon]
MRINRFVVLLALMTVTASLGVSGAALGGASGRTADSDNDFATATALTSGVQTSGSVNGTDDPSDFYKIDLRAGQCMKVVLSYTCASLPLYFSVYDPGQNDVLDITSGNTTRGDTYFAIENGTHYVEIWTFSEEQSYTLTVTVSLPATLTPGVQVRSMLSFTGVERSEWFRIWLQGNLSGKSEGVYVNMTEDDRNTNCNLFLWDLIGGLNPYNLSRGASPRETVSLAASYTGWYYLLANIWSGSGGYTLDVTGFQTPSDGNNDHGNATFARHNAVIAGTVDQGWDKYDWYRYHVFAGDTFQARASRQAGTDLFNLSIYDSAGALLAGDLNIQGGALTNSITLAMPAAQAERYYHVAIYSYAAVRNNQITDDTARETYSLALTSTNHVPSVLSSFEDLSTQEDVGVSTPATTRFSDIDGDAIIINVTGQTNLAAAVCATTGNLEIMPKLNWAGRETLTVTADDGYGGKVSLTVNVTVAAVNDLPYVKKGMADIRMFQGGVDTSVDLSRVFSDDDIPYGDKLAYSVDKNGSLRVTIDTDGKVTLTGPIEFYGLVSMTFTATDLALAQASAQCNVTVVHVNQPPRLRTHPGNVSVDEDRTATLDMSGVFSDLDGDPVTLLPSGMTRITVLVDPNTLIVTFKPSPNLSGFYEDVTFTAQDDKGYGNEFVVVRVTVVVVNDPPVLKSSSPQGTVTMNEGDTEEFSVTVTTVESWDTFNYTWYLDDLDLLWNEDTYPLKTDFDSAGQHVLRVVVDDGHDKVERVWNITVVNVNRNPKEVKINTPRTGDSYMERTEVEFSGSAKDDDGDELTYTWLDGRTEIGTGKSFSTTALKPGVHTIVLEVSDGTGTTKSKQVSITITPNTSPQILSLEPTTGARFQPGKRIDFTVQARDAEGDPLTYQWSLGGRVLSTQPSFSASDIKEGTHSIMLSIYDGYTYTNQTVMVQVAPSDAGGAGSGILGGNMMLLLVAAVGAIAMVGGIAVWMMRRKRPGAPDVAPPPADSPGALSDQYDPAPRDDQAPPVAPGYDYGAYQAPAGTPEPYDLASAYQQSAGAASYPPGTYQQPAEAAPGDPGQPPVETQYDQSQYSPEAGISGEQPGVSGSQPAWASGQVKPTLESPSAPESPPPETPAPASEAPPEQPPEPEKKE